MADSLPVAVSILALAISATTAWLTLFRRGTVRMSQPSVIYFGPDGSRDALMEGVPKVFLRTLLFATSKRGRIVESLYVRVSRNESRQTFNIWVYGDDKLTRGSGLFVGESGVNFNHHFLAPRDENGFRFVEGTYRLELFAKLLGDNTSKLMFVQSLDVTKALADALASHRSGLYFDWGQETSRYMPHIDVRAQ